MNVEEQTEVIRWSGDEIERLTTENAALMKQLAWWKQKALQTTEADNWEDEGGAIEPLIETVKSRIADPKIVEVDIDDL